LTATLRKICANSFDGDDLRLLMVDLRQFMHKSLLRDIADYIAHPEGRSQGLSHSEIDLNYWRARRLANQDASLHLTPLTDHFFALWLYGIGRTPRGFAKKHFGCDSQTARKLVSNAFAQRGKEYHLRAALTAEHFAAVRQIMLAVFNVLHPQP